MNFATQNWSKTGMKTGMVGRFLVGSSILDAGCQMLDAGWPKNAHGRECSIGFRVMARPAKNEPRRAARSCVWLRIAATFVGTFC